MIMRWKNCKNHTSFNSYLEAYHAARDSGVYFVNIHTCDECNGFHYVDRDSGFDPDEYPCMKVMINDDLYYCMIGGHCGVIKFTQSVSHFKDCYVRFGDGIPKGGKSYNYAIKEFEDGVSVYPALTDGVDYIIKLNSDFHRIDEFDRMSRVSAFQQYTHNKKCMLMDGCAIGIGGDGEPLLSNSRVLKWINIPIYTLYEYKKLKYKLVS